MRGRVGIHLMHSGWLLSMSFLPWSERVCVSAGGGSSVMLSRNQMFCVVLLVLFRSNVVSVVLRVVFALWCEV